MNREPESRRYFIGKGESTSDNVQGLITNNTIADYERYGYGRLSIIRKADNRFIGFTRLNYLDDFDEVDAVYRSVR